MDGGMVEFVLARVQPEQRQMVIRMDLGSLRRVYSLLRSAEFIMESLLSGRELPTAMEDDV
eukprot:148272-Hanusia_phi.AAC.9